MIVDIRVLTDADLQRVLTMDRVIGKVSDALRERARGTLVAPPRVRLDGGKGALVFTMGAALGTENVTGFRVYDTYPGDDAGHAQLVSVYDADTGALRGIVIGQSLGALRTGALGGVAIRTLALESADVLAVIGAGLQAWYQVQAALAVRTFRIVRVYSRTEERRNEFAERVQQQFGVQAIPVHSAKDCVEEADVVICATSSRTPVFQAGWLKPGAHVNTLGPKSREAHEIGLDVADRSAVIITDSLVQVSAYPKPFFLLDTPHYARMTELAEWVHGGSTAGRKSHDITLFCSVGLAGTEVVVAAEALQLAEECGIGTLIHA